MASTATDWENLGYIFPAILIGFMWIACGMALGDLEWPNIADVEISDMLYGIQFREGMRYTFSGSFVALRIIDCDYAIYITMYTVSRRGKTWGVAVANGIIEGSEYAILQEDYSAVQLTNVEVVGKVKSHWDGEPVKQYKTDTSSFSPDYHITYKKPNSFLYVVEADKTGKSDISAQLQKKLDEAEKIDDESNKEAEEEVAEEEEAA